MIQVAFNLWINPLPKYLKRIEFASINNKPIFVSQVVTNKNSLPFLGDRNFQKLAGGSYLMIQCLA